MKTMTRADFAALAHVSKIAITKAVRSGLIVSLPDKSIDSDDPHNVDYLKFHNVSSNVVSKKRLTPAKIKKAGKALAQPIPSNPRPMLDAEPEEEPEEDDTQDMSDALDASLAAVAMTNDEKTKYTIARRKQAEADTKLKEKKTAQLKGVLIPREAVRRKFSQFDASLKSSLRDMPRRISAQVYAVAVSGNEKTVEAYLEKEISAAISRAVQEAVSQGL